MNKKGSYAPGDDMARGVVPEKNRGSKGKNTRFDRTEKLGGGVAEGTRRDRGLPGGGAGRGKGEESTEGGD